MHDLKAVNCILRIRKWKKKWKVVDQLDSLRLKEAIFSTNLWYGQKYGDKTRLYALNSLSVQEANLLEKTNWSPFNWSTALNFKCIGTVDKVGASWCFGRPPVAADCRSLAVYRFRTAHGGIIVHKRKRILHLHQLICKLLWIHLT